MRCSKQKHMPDLKEFRKSIGWKKCTVLGSALLCAVLTFSSLPVHAETLTDDGNPYDQAAEEARQQEEIQSNSVTGWPEGPVVSAEGAVLMDMDTGAILYNKNADEKLYPASTTKMMTCLIAVENLDLDDTVTFSETAINSVPADGSNIGMDIGETITVEQCLYGILVGSANECANAIAEKVAGSIDAFVELMNAKAEELGCTGTHFANANGLYDDNHYTTPHDLALIARAFFNNDTLAVIGNTASYTFTATDTQPDTFTITNKHRLITGEVAYDGILGGKTGYTDEAKECLVTGCEQNGCRLVCVVMMEDSPKQFTDTVSLFDYGYSSFTQENVADNDSTYVFTPAGFFSSGDDLLGESEAALSIDADAVVDVPNTATFEDLNSSVAGNVITYTFGDASNAVTVGTAALSLSENAGATAKQAEADAGTSGSENRLKSAISSFVRENIADTIGDTTYVSIPALIIIGAGILSVILLLIIIHAIRRAMRRRQLRQRRGGYYPAARNRARHTYSSSDYQRRQKKRRRDAYLREDYDDYRERDDDQDNY